MGAKIPQPASKCTFPFVFDQAKSMHKIPDHCILVTDTILTNSKKTTLNFLIKDKNEIKQMQRSPRSSKQFKQD